MSDKLEALSHPVAFDYQIAGACVSDYPNPVKWVDWRTELSCECPPDWMIEEGKVKDLKPRYSQEYVTALLAENAELKASLSEWEDCKHDGATYHDMSGRERCGRCGADL
jgi:hypothetical protein